MKLLVSTLREDHTIEGVFGYTITENNMLAVWLSQPQKDNDMPEYAFKQWDFISVLER